MRLPSRLLILVLLIFTACGTESEESLRSDGPATADTDQSGDSPTNEPAKNTVDGIVLLEGLPS